MEDESELVVEVHIPLASPAGAVDDDEPHPWIDDVLDYLEDVEARGEASVIDEGEEFDGSLVFSLADGTERALLAIANRIAALPGIPTGVFAVVTSELADEFGQGRRVELG